MFTFDSSEVWDSSEFQDSFIKDYFGKPKVSEHKTKDKLNLFDGFKRSLALKKTNSCSLNQEFEDEKSEIFIKANVSNTKHILNSPVEDNMKKRIKLSSNSSEERCLENNEYDLNPDKLEVKTSASCSNSLKAKKKRKQKQKNEVFIEMQTSQNKCLESLKNDAISDKWELDSSTVNSNPEKSKKKKKRKHKNKVNTETQTSLNSSQGTPKEVGDEMELQTDKEETEIIPNQLSRKTFFQNKLYQKLQAAKFRYLNEMLYTSTGKDALSYFKENAEEFQDYHLGYQSQVSKWPINPVDIIIKELQEVNKQSIIADLGCGEAKIAEIFPKRTVYSFDLIALKDCVTACDIANVPLPNESVDVVVFCLSLMGTNWKDYLKEGHRLLKLGGELKIAEIESRIDNLNELIKTIEAHGFSLLNKNLSHKMFIFLNFKKRKNKVKTSKIPNITLKPCLYKKR